MSADVGRALVWLLAAVLVVAVCAQRARSAPPPAPMRTPAGMSPAGGAPNPFTAGAWG